MRRIWPLISLGAFFAPLVTLAQFGIPLVPASCRGGICNLCDFIELVNNLQLFLIFAATIIATGVLVYAGILFATSSVNPGNINKAKGMFGNVIWGFIFILSAWLIVNTLLSTLSVDLAFNPLKGNINVRCTVSPSSAATQPPSTPGTQPPPPPPTTSGGYVPVKIPQTSGSCIKQGEYCVVKPELASALEKFQADLGYPYFTITSAASPGGAFSGGRHTNQCHNSDSVSGGTCVDISVPVGRDHQSVIEAADRAGLRAVLEMPTSQGCPAGAPAGSCITLPHCSTGLRPCLTGAHYSVYKK